MRDLVHMWVSGETEKKSIILWEYFEKKTKIFRKAIQKVVYIYYINLNQGPSNDLLKYCLLYILYQIKLSNTLILDKDNSKLTLAN